MVDIVSYVTISFLFLQATKLKIKATIWKRQSVEDGGLFVKYYGVLEKGRLDLYYKEKVVFKFINCHNFTHLYLGLS